MKTILTRMKTLVIDAMVDTGTLSYVKSVEILHPNIALSAISIATLPKICIVPENSREEWVASQKKSDLSLVSVYIIMLYIQRESSLIGDANRPGGQGKGIIDVAEDFISCVRGHRLAVGGENYLSKPMDVTGVDYIQEDLTDQGQLLIARVSLEAERLFVQQTLPGNV